MRSAALALAAAALAACASPGVTQPPVSFPLVNADFEEVPRPGDCPRGWGCASHNDPTSFRFFLAPGAPSGGRNSLCVEPVKQ
ncbi:MAG TPA: hypothetical protein VLS49_14515, partial [Usitatibacter sp.]|nr:hypothetical protein [Usitatibacter sp.]